MADLTAYETFLHWLEANRIGDLTGLVGIAISLIGFSVTVYGVRRSKSAAERAEIAAKETRESIKLFDTVVEFSSAITTLEEIKRLHREENWPLLLERYGQVRRLLANLNGPQISLNSAQADVVRRAHKTVCDVETLVERSLKDTSKLEPAHFNKLIGRDIDKLIAVLGELKSTKAGV